MQGMQPDVALLQGLALVEQLGEEQVVIHYPARGLSQDPATRFAQLFATRPRHAHSRPLTGHCITTAVLHVHVAVRACG